MEAKRLSRADWINAAMKVLSTGGIELVRVDRLAKKLNITRGSFYYHFASREDLLESMLETWRVRATEAVVKDLKDKSIESKEQLVRLMVLPLQGAKSAEAAYTEISIRAWGRRNEVAKRVVDEVDRYRVGFVADLFVELGHNRPRANDLAYLVYSYIISTSLVDVSSPKSVRQERAERILNMLVEDVVETDT